MDMENAKYFIFFVTYELILRRHMLTMRTGNS
jgi:hypothetical protein